MEKLQNSEQMHEARHASEILYSKQELLESVRTAVDASVITASPREAGSTEKTDMRVTVPAKADEISVHDGVYKAADGSGYFSEGTFDWVAEDGLMREAHEVHNALIEEATREIAPWYVYDDVLTKKIEDDESISQIFNFGVEDKNLQLINFSAEHELSDEQVTQISETIGKVANSGGMGFMDSVRGIAIVNHQDINGGQEDKEDPINSAIGLFKNYNGVLMLSEKLLTEGIEPNRHGLEGVTRLETTLAHELGHAAQRFGWKTYSDALNWEQETSDVVDDFGNVRKSETHKLGQVNDVQRVFKDGSIQKVNTKDYFTEEDLESVAPTTWYGATQSLEDFAEATVPYFLEGRHTDKVDVIRKSAIATTLHEKNAFQNLIHGPYLVSTERVDLATLEKAPIELTPKELTVALNIFVAPTEENKGTNKKIVDDYGNVQVVRQRGSYF